MRKGLSYHNRRSSVAQGASLSLNFVNGQTLDPRITFTRASSATYFDSTGTLQTATTNVPRFDYNPSTKAAQGLLIEEQRTNSIRNNTMQGAVAGTPGTAPTNYTLTSGGGVTRTIVGIGTENGITYIDVQFTSAAANNFFIIPEPSTQIAAASGQTWTSSFYVRLIAGSLTNLVIDHNVQENSAAGAFLAATIINFVPTTAALVTQRNTISRTLNNASTAYVQSYLRGVASGAYDITLRIGLPQLELGAFATSVIPTTNAAATRSADVASMTGTNFSSWYNATEGTLFVQWETSVSDATNNRGIASIDDGSNNNRLALFIANSAAPLAVASRVVSGGAATNPANSGSIALSATAKTALAYAVGTNQAALCVNGATPTTASPAATPVSPNVLRIGAIFGVTQIGGWIKRIAYYPVRLSNASLQALTA